MRHSALVVGQERSQHKNGKRAASLVRGNQERVAAREQVNKVGRSMQLATSRDLSKT